MILDPRLIENLENAADRYEDDPFFGVRSREGDFFVFNWVLGLRFREDEIVNCREVDQLEDATDRMCSLSDHKREIIQHIHQRGWMDILVGTGLYQDATLVKLCDDEKFVFEQKGWDVLPFETDGGRRYYVRELYFDYAESVIGDEIKPVIFRPIVTTSYVPDYRPMLFQDDNGDVRGIVYAVSEDNMRNPINREAEYAKEVEAALPEFYEGRRSWK